MNIMLNKYYVTIEQNNDINIYVILSLMNEQQLQQQLQQIYNDAFVFVEHYNCERVEFLKLMQLNNICVARNIERYNYNL